MCPNICENTYVNDKVVAEHTGFNLDKLARRPGRLFARCPMPTGTCCAFQTSNRRWPKIRDLTLLSDILPTGYHRCIEAETGPDRPSTSLAPPLRSCEFQAARGLVHHRR